MLCFDLDCPTPYALRSETIRAIRSTGRPSEQTAGSPPSSVPTGLFHSAAAILRDLGQGLEAISQSLAEGVDGTVGRRCALP